MLRIGHLSTFYHTAPLLMAEGILEKSLPVKVSWKLFGNGPDMVEAFDRKELDLGYIGLPPAIMGISRGVRIICIAGGHMEGTVLSGKLGLSAYPVEKDLGKVLGQLKGGQIGVPGRGSIHDVIIREYLARFGLAGDVAVCNYRWSDEITEAVVKGDVTAAVGTPSLAVALKRYADCQILYPPYLLWPKNPSYGIVADKEFLEKNTRLIELFLGFHEEATSRIRKDPGGAARIISACVGIVDPDFLLETFRISPKYCSQLTDDYKASSLAFIPVLKRWGYISRDVAYDEIFDEQHVRKVHGEGDHYEEGIAPDTQ